MRIEGKALVIAGDGLFDFSLVSVEHTEVVIGLRVLGVDFNGCLHDGVGFVKLLGSNECNDLDMRISKGDLVFRVTLPWTV